MALLVSHPAVKTQSTKWESIARPKRQPKPCFLDRDGVINKAFVRDGKPFSPPTQQDLEILPGVPEALRDLRSHGYKLLVVTNQPDVARGKQSQQALDAIHNELRAKLPLDDILACVHTDEDNCDCRKPLPGMLLEAAKKHNIDMAASYMIGDRWKDIEAGYNAGCKTILVDYGYSERRSERVPDHIVKSLREAADWIIRSKIRR